MLRVGCFFEDDGYDWDRIQADAGDGVELLVYDDCKSWDETTLVERLRTVDVMVTARKTPRVPDALIADRGRLKLVAHCFGHVKQLLGQAHVDAGLLVSNWGDNVTNIGEAALMFTLVGLKQLPLLDRFIRSDWTDDRRIHQEFEGGNSGSLKGRDVGIYGYGPIGRHYARMLKPFEPVIHIYDPFAKDVPDHIIVEPTLAELFINCQVVSIHCGLNDATRGSVNKAVMDGMVQGGVIVNTARGPIINEQDLADQLAARRLFACIDVIENERDWAHSPLMAHDNGIVTGHKISGGKGPEIKTGQGKKRLPGYVIDNIRALAEGREPTNVITPEEFPLKT